MNKTFEDFGIKGVKIPGTAVQRVQCPKCAGKTPTNSLTVWLVDGGRDGTWSCAKCNWGKGLRLNSSGANYGNSYAYTPLEKKPTFHELGDSQVAWLTARGISRAVLNRNRVVCAENFFAQIQAKRPCLAFQYFVGGELVNVKYRDKDKHFAQTTGGHRALYKIDDLAGSTDAIICEGEIDALSFEVAGFTNAVSVPDGAPAEGSKNLDVKLAFLEYCYPYYKHIERWYIACDNDNPGRLLAEELARRLGKRRAYMVRFPAGSKDANDVLVKHGAQALKACIDNAELYPVDGAIDPESRFDYLDDIYEYGFTQGARTVELPIFDSHLEFHAGQLTVVTGIPSHGKSTFVDNIAVYLNQNSGWKTAFFTPENSPLELHLIRMVSIIAGATMLKTYNTYIDRQKYDRAKAQIRGQYFYIQPPNDLFTIDKILEIAEYYVAAKGVKMLVIDPWNSILHNRSREQNETEYTARALNQIKYAARHFGTHNIVVAHPTKMPKINGQTDEVINYEAPSLYNISGSANWYNIADNGIIVYRHRLSKDESETRLIIEKIKHKYYGKTGQILLKMDVASERFSEMNGQNFKNSHIEENYRNF